MVLTVQGRLKYGIQVQLTIEKSIVIVTVS